MTTKIKIQISFISFRKLVFIEVTNRQLQSQKNLYSIGVLTANTNLEETTADKVKGQQTFGNKIFFTNVIENKRHQRKKPRN